MSPLKTTVTSVHGTLHLVVFLMLVAGTLAAAYRAYSEEEQVFREEFHKQLGDLIASLKINQLMAWQDERQGDAQVAMNSAALMPGLEKALGPAPEARAQVLRWMEQIRQSYKYSGVELLDPAGNVSLAIGTSLAGPEFYKALAAETTRSRQILFRYFPKDAVVGQSHFAACAPLYSRSGLQVGSLVLNVDPWLYPFPELLKWPSATRSGRIFLGRRENGNVRVIGAGSGKSGMEPDESVISLSQTMSPFFRAVVDPEREV